MGYIPENIDNKGTANGYASLDESGKIPSSQLPSYVDDVIEVVNFSSLPVTGEIGKIYVTIDTNFEYRWSGSTYIRLIASPGTTDAIAEGTINKYYTDARVAAYIGANSISGTVNYLPKFTGANAVGDSLIYDDGSKIGFGTNTPLTFFHVDSGSAIPIRISTSNDEVAQFISSNAYGGFRVAVTGAGTAPGNGTPYIALNVGAALDGSSLGTQKVYFAYNLNTANIASLGYNSGTDAISYLTSGANAGFVGIGTNAPAYKLHVNGDMGADTIYATYGFRGGYFRTPDALFFGGNPATASASGMFHNLYMHGIELKAWYPASDVKLVFTVYDGNTSKSAVMTTTDFTSPIPFSAPTLKITGTAGLGYINLPNQTSASSPPVSGANIYWETNQFVMYSSAGYLVKLNTGSVTANRTYTFPDIGGSLVVNPMTTQYDIAYGGVGGTPTRLAAPVATGHRKFLSTQGNGTVATDLAYVDLFGTTNTWSARQTFGGGARSSQYRVTDVGGSWEGDITPDTLSNGRSWVMPDADGWVTVLNTNAAPGSSGSSGKKGTIIVSGGYAYICIANSSWVRAAVTTF